MIFFKCCKEIRKNMSQGDRVTNFLVGIGIIRLFGNGFGMHLTESLIEHGDMSDDAQSVDHDDCLGGIAIMPVHIRLTDLGIGFRFERKWRIHAYVRIVALVSLCYPWIQTHLCRCPPRIFAPFYSA